MTAITSVEELRGGLAALAPVTLALALSGMDRDPGTDREAAAAAFGLQAEVEPDQPGAEVGTDACSWCGRTGTPLTDQYPRPAPPLPVIDIDTGQQMPAVAPGQYPAGPKPAPPPPVDPSTGLFYPAGTVAAPESAEVPNPGDQHCANETDCQAARDQAEPLWFDRQMHGWKIDWDRYREALAVQESYRGGIYAPGHRGYWELSREPDEDELSQLELAALEQVRDMVEGKTARYLELTAPPGMSDPATPQAPPPVIKFDPWGHVLGRNRVHTLGHKITHHGPCTAACLTAEAVPVPPPAAPGVTRTRRRRHHLRRYNSHE